MITYCRRDRRTYLRRAMAQIHLGWNSGHRSGVLLLSLRDMDLIESDWERSRQGHSIQVETVGEFRCRLRR